MTIATALALATGFVSAPAGAAPTPSKFTATAVQPAGAPIQAAKSVSGKLAKSDPALLARTDSAPVNIFVKLDYDAAATYSGEVSGLAATSPSSTGKKLAKSTPAVARYLNYVDRQSISAKKEIAAKVPSAKVTGSFSIAYGGLSARVPANKVKDLLKVPGVVAVQQDKVEKILTDATPKFIGATKVWPSLGGSTKAGQGVIVGVLDTGIWPEHPSFIDNGISKPAGGPWKCDFGDGTDPKLGAPFTCNDKLIGAYSFLATNLANNATVTGDYCDGVTLKCSARDSDGHGTHTTSTAAGSAVAHAPIFGIDRGPISGIAPGASVIMYRVCLAGCYGSDSVAAIQQAILDGVNVINFSISGGTDPYHDPVELAFLDAYAAGISVSASAGNEGPAAGTAAHASPWVTTVGASTSDRHFASTLQLTATDGATFSKVGSTLTVGVTDKPVVLAASVTGYTGTKNCLTPFAAGSVAGKIVVCERGGGGGGRIEKGLFASQGGAAGMILYNPIPSDVETDNHFLPAIHLEGPNDEFLAFLAAHPGVTATWATGQKATVRGDVMAGFSSRGGSDTDEFIKPDITAPGVQILAGNTPTPIEVAGGAPGQLFQAIAGTSMSSPHSAGVAALLKAAHPNWTPGQIKSAEMTSAVQDVVKEDGVTPADPFDEGSGSLRADRAVSPTVTFDVPASAYYASQSDALDRVDLNIPSIHVNPLAGSLTTYRTAKNVSGAVQTFKVRVTGADGLKITVEPSTFQLKPNAKQKLKITIDGTSTTDGWHFGQLKLDAQGPLAHDALIPIAVKRGDAAVTLTNTCTPATVHRYETPTCTVTATNFSSTIADSKIKVTVPPKFNLQYVSAPAHKSGNTGLWSGPLSAAKPSVIDSVLPGASPAEGYLPLSDYGIPAQTAFGDETILNFNVPAFKYGGVTYSTLAIDSNGYVVVGGGDGTANQCCSPVIPSPSLPNNVIAPYWTDLSLDPATGGGAVRIGSLTDGAGGSWIVVDYAGVKAFGNGGTGPANTFEIWIQTGATEGQWLSYDTLGGPGGSDLVVGAENSDGSSGATVTGTPTGEYAIKTSPPTAGGSVSFSYQGSSPSRGNYDLLAQLTTPVVKGSITKKFTLGVIL